MKKLLYIILSIIFISGNVYAQPFEGGYGPFPGKKGLFEAEADLLYLRLDIANDPLQPLVDTTTVFQILDADGGTPILNIDSINERVGVGTSAPSTPLEVNGIITAGGVTAGASTFGDGGITNYAGFSATGNLQFFGSAQYLIAANTYAFAYDALPDYGLMFSLTNGSVDIMSGLTGSAIPIIRLGANTPEIEIEGIQSIGSNADARLILRDYDDNTFIIEKNDDGEASLVNDEGPIHLKANGDTNDYLSIITVGDQTTLNWAGQNGRITAGSGTIDFDNENLTTTGTIQAEQLTSTDDITMAGLFTNTHTAANQTLAIFQDSANHGVKLTGWSSGVNIDPITANDNIYFGRDIDLTLTHFETGNVLVGTQSMAAHAMLGVVKTDAHPTIGLSYYNADNAFDPQILFKEWTSAVWAMGVDTGQSNRFVLTPNTLIGDQTTGMLMDTSGHVTFSGNLTSGQIIDNGLTANLGVYTDVSKQLTSTPPSSGILGYWDRTATVVSPSNAGDDITTTGTITGEQLTSTDDITVPQSGKICLDGASCTDYIVSDGTRVYVYINNVLSEDIDVPGSVIIGGYGDVTINNQAGAYSLTVKGGTETQLFYLSGANDVVTIGGNLTNALFNVNGAAYVLGSLELDNNINHDGSNIGFFGVAPANRATAAEDIKDAFTTYGLLQGTSATPLDLDDGQLTAGIIQGTDDTFWTGDGSGIPYGSLYLHEGAQNIDISAVGQGVYVKLTGFTTGLLNAVTINSDAFNVDNIGVYKIDWQVSGDSQGNNKDYEIDIFVNGVEQSDGSSRKEFGASGSLGSMSGTAIIDITNIAHDIDIRMKEVGGGGGTDIDIFNMSFNITMVGGT